MEKSTREFAKTTKLKIMGLAAAGLAGAAGLMANGLAYAEEPIIEIFKTNYGNDFHITQIDEGANMIKAAWDMNVGWSPATRDYDLTDYHIFLGEVSDDDLPGMLNRADGVTTIARGSDGATIFGNPYAQIELVAPEGVSLADNSAKVITYVVKSETKKPELSDKIIAGRVDYSRCTSSIGYAETGGVFCSRDEYADGESFYSAYDQSWKKLKPAREVEYVDRVVEVPTEVEKIVEKIIEKEVPVEVAKEVMVERLVTEVKEVLKPFGVPVIVNNESVVKNTETGVESQAEEGITTDTTASSEGISATTEVPEVPELGGPKKNSAGSLLWWLGLSGMVAVGATGALFWFVLPMIAPRRRRSEKSDQKRK